MGRLVPAAEEIEIAERGGAEEHGGMVLLFGPSAPGPQPPGRARRGLARGKLTEPMTRYALLLRGVNVGTKNSLPMADLRDLLSKLGCSGTRTYVQSGNAVFETEREAEALTVDVEEALARRMGRPVGTTLRTGSEMAGVVEGNPFAGAATNPAHLCVTFLSVAPTEAELAPLRAQDFGLELFRASGREIYAWHPNGQGRSPLAAAIGKLRLRGTATTRNWNTVSKLLEMLRER